MLLARDSLKLSGHTKEESEGWEKDPPDDNEKAAGAALFISYKIDSKSKLVARDKEGHYNG